MIELVELFNVPDKKKWIGTLKGLTIQKIRNQVGAHTVNYQLPDGEKRRDSYRLTQVSVNKWGDGLAVVSSAGGVAEYNLLQLLDEYHDIAEDLLQLICNKAIQTIFPNPSEHKSWLINRFNFARGRKYRYREQLK